MEKPLYNKFGLQCPLIKANHDYPTIGQLVEVYDTNFEMWSIAQIIDICNGKIKINYYGWSDRYDEWINKNDKTKLAALATHTFAMKPLAKPPNIYSLQTRLYRAMVHNSHVFIEDHMYDIKMNKWSKIKAIKDMPFLCGSIDHATNTIYYVQKDGIVYTLNIKTLQWEQHNVASSRLINLNYEKDINCEFINNKLHVIHFANGKHVYNYDINTKQWTVDHNHSQVTDNETGVFHKKTIYIESKQMFLTFVNSINRENPVTFHIYYCEYNGDRWVKYKELTLNNVIIDDVINIFDHLLLVRFDNVKIMFFDLLTSKWFECDKILPVSGKPPHAMANAMDNYVYFITGANRDIDLRTHYKICLTDMIPLKLNNLYRDNKYNKLIFGYINEMQNNESTLYNFPFYLKKLVLQYYPCFLYC